MSQVSSSISNIVTIGAGCYWGTEKFVKKDFQDKFPKSIKSAKVGFMSPKNDDEHRITDPTYRQVCSGKTDFVEVLHVELNYNDDDDDYTKDPNTLFENLIKFFFQFHDPTTMNRQGNDRGTQYASVIFVHDDEQERIVKDVMGQLQSALHKREIKNPYFGDHIVTNVWKATKFYPAHEEHQEYLMKNPTGYCNHYFRFKEWPLWN